MAKPKNKDREFPCGCWQSAGKLHKCVEHKQEDHAQRSPSSNRRRKNFKRKPKASRMFGF